MNTRLTQSGSAATGEPTGGRIDDAAATQGSGGGVGMVGSNDPNLNTGGALGTPPDAGVADQPPDEEADPAERAGAMTGPDPKRDVSTVGGSLGSDQGGAIDSVADAAARGDSGSG